MQNQSTCPAKTNNLVSLSAALSQPSLAQNCTASTRISVIAKKCLL